MHDLTAIELKAFVPAKDFEKSRRFYQDLGFTTAWSSDGLAYIRHGNTSFLLQEFPVGIDNFMMHLLVQDVDAWCPRRVAAIIYLKVRVVKRLRSESRSKPGSHSGD